MKKIRSIMSVIAIGFVLLVMPKTVQADSRIDAKNIETNINVREDGVYEIHQVIDVYFHGQNQGIFVEIPQKYKDFQINGESRDYFFPVSNFKMISDDAVDIDQNSDGLVARIGTKGQYHTGDKRYEYSYEIQTRPLGTKGYDLFYFNIIGNNWQFSIENVDFSVTFPKPFTYEPFFYVGSQNQSLDYTVDGNTVKGSYDGGLFYEAITMELQLDEGYFVYPTSDSTPIALILFVLFGAAVVALYYKFGKDDEPIEVVSFEAPEGLSSAEIGYVYRGHSTTKDIVSLIVYWASRGYLILEELDEKGDNIQITKIKDLDTYTNPEEKRVFNALFKKGDVITTDGLNQTFGETVMHASANIRKRFTSDKNLRVFDRKASVWKGICYGIAPLLVGFFTAMAYYSKTLYPGSAIIGFIMGAVLSAVFLGCATVAFNKDGINMPTRSKGLRVLMIVLSFMILGALGILLIVVTETALWKAIVMCAILFVVSVAISNMGRRTEQGNAWYGEILGLETFIKVAEEDRIKALVEETPYIFYDILPYAYVLGITDAWIKKFEKLTIVQPDWYVSSNPNFTTFYMLHSLNRSMSTISSSMVSVVPTPSGSSGGGGSFGGGGGGGFSGGGFGGGGGGGW